MSELTVIKLHVVQVVAGQVIPLIPVANPRKEV